MSVRSLHEHEFGLSWVVDDYLSRASHALVHDGGVWLIDPVDEPAAIERALALGTPAGVLQLYRAHERDGAALAKRLGVELHRQPSLPAGVPFAPVPLNALAGLWSEQGLWWPERRVLVVTEAVGTGHLYALGPGPAGVHPMRRTIPPTSLRAYRPLHLLVGHGAPLEGELASSALLDALNRSRRDLPRLALKAGDMIRGLQARR